MKNFAPVVCFVAFFTVSLLVPASRAEDAPATYLLQSGRQAGQIDRVVIVVKVAGERLERASNGVHRAPLSGVGNLSYDEKILELAATPAGHSRSIRYYDAAKAVFKVGDAGDQQTLRPERRLIGVDVEADKCTLFSPQGALTSDELDLIDVSDNSLLLDCLLPERPVAVGQKWEPADQDLRRILQLDEVRRSDVECVLKEVTPELARIVISGRLSGTVHGVPCQHELKAKCRFDRKRNRIDWLAMLIDDKRDISDVEPGLDVLTTVNICISPRGQSEWLTPRALAEAPLKPAAELCRLLCQPADAAWQLTHERCWHLVDSHRELAALRMMVNGADLAQCNVSSLPTIAPERLPTLEQFQEEVRTALGKSFGQFVEAAQFPSETSDRVYRVVVKGEYRDVPCQWYYYLVADRHGRQVALVFTVQEQNVEAFDKAGDRLVRGLRFLDPKVATTAAE